MSKKGSGNFMVDQEEQQDEEEHKGYDGSDDDFEQKKIDKKGGMKNDKMVKDD